MYKVFDKITAIAETTHAQPVTKLLASIGLPAPPANMKFSLSSIDELLARQNLSIARRMEIKSELRLAGLIA
jgi:hypothetical protein